jgi:hypothetical protein
MTALFVIAILLAVVSIILAIKASSVKHHRALAQRRLDAIAERADEQNNWILDGDMRGFYGDYPVPDLWPNKTMTEIGAAVEAVTKPEEPSEDWALEKLNELRRKDAAEAMAARIKEEYEADFGGRANILTVNEQRRQAELARLDGIASANHAAGTVIETWGGDVIRVLHDINALINAAKPAQVLHATPTRKPAKRISERKALEHYVADLDG